MGISADSAGSQGSLSQWSYTINRSGPVLVKNFNLQVHKLLYSGKFFAGANFCEYAIRGSRRSFHASYFCDKALSTATVAKVCTMKNSLLYTHVLHAAHVREPL